MFLHSFSEEAVLEVDGGDDDGDDDEDEDLEEQCAEFDRGGVSVAVDGVPDGWEVEIKQQMEEYCGQNNE